MAVTHARIKYLQNDFIEFAPIDNIQEFKKVRPKHKMDFSKTKVYNAVYQDEKNPQPVLLHVQIADLACGLSDMESMQRKRPSLARINVSDIPNTSSNKSESENEDAEQQLSQVQITQKKKLMMVQRGKKILSKINNRNTSLKEIVDSDDNSDLENVGNNSQLSLSTGIDHQEKEKETDPLHMTSNIEAQNSNRKSKSGIGAGTINIDLENKIQFFRVELPSSSGCRPSIVPEPNNTQVNNDNPVNLSSFAGCRSIDNPQGNNDSSVSLPRRSPVRSPSRSPIRSPSRSPSRSPIRSPSRSPIRSPIRSPSRSPSRSPIRSPINSDRSRSPAPLDDAQLENNEFVKKFVSRSIIESIEFYKAKEGYGFEERSKRYKPTEDGMLYLGEGKSIKADIWRMMMVDKPNIFYRKLLTKLWDPRDLANRALQKEKVSKPIHNRSPVKNVESNLLRLSISLFNDFLDKQRIYTPEDKANFLKQTRNILSQKIRDLRAIERQKASGVNAPRKKLRYD